MKNRLILVLLSLSLVVLCHKSHLPMAAAQTSQGGTSAGEQQLAPTGFTGRAVEAIRASRYTYVQVDTGTEKIWAATPQFKGKVGDIVTVPPQGLPMKNFHSNTLNRDFELVYFVGTIVATGQDASSSKQVPIPGHPPVSEKRSVPQGEISGVERAKNGKTVAEVYAAREDLAGKPVLVRGRVVKFIPKIMGKNWLHLQDGSGSEGTNDLTVTTDVMVEVGDLVLVSGVVSVDRDFGYGYSYEVILENAEVKVE